jgi:NADH-quinone oxidoreductase subunit J
MVSNSLFIIFSSTCLLSAFFVVFSKNPIFSILFLILCFCNVSSILFLFNFEFLPISFLVIYVGAIAVLFLFILMMINIKLAELNENQTNFLPIIMLFCFVFLFELLMLFRLEFTTIKLYDESSKVFLTEFLINFGLNFDFMNLIFKYSNLKMAASALFNNYLYCFFLAGVILLLAMVGTIILTLQKQFISKTQNVYAQILKDYTNSIIHYS